MGRRRKTNKHLPQRVYLYHGRYWFMERSGRRRDLGTTEAEMYSKLAEFADRRTLVRTMNRAFDRYLLESLPHLAPRTQSDYRGYIAYSGEVDRLFRRNVTGDSAESAL